MIKNLKMKCASVMDCVNEKLDSRRLRIALTRLSGCSLGLSLVYMLRVFAGAHSVILALFADASPPCPSLFLLVIASAGVVCLNAWIFVRTLRSEFAFSRPQSHCLVVLSAMLIVCALLELLTAASFSPNLMETAVVAIAGTASPFGTFNIEILLIVAAFVSFNLSYIFNYSSFLQWFYDETV